MKKLSLLILILAGCMIINAQSGKEIKKMQIITKETWNNTDSKSKFLETVEKFDEEGNLIEEIKYNPGKSIRKQTKWTYNENNDKLTETEYDSSGKVTSRKEYTYEGSLRTSRKEYDEKGKLVSWEIYKFEYAK
jgi:antitoxin component YwqK of YwqJK toxin-antitoxin module